MTGSARMPAMLLESSAEEELHRMIAGSKDPSSAAIVAFSALSVWMMGRQAGDEFRKTGDLKPVLDALEIFLEATKMSTTQVNTLLKAELLHLSARNSVKPTRDVS